MGLFNSLFDGIWGSGTDITDASKYIQQNIYTTSTNSGGIVGQQKIYSYGNQQAMKGLSGMGAGRSIGSIPNPMDFSTFEIIDTLKGYATLTGSEVEHVHLPEGVATNDPLVSILKLSNVNEVVKDVGVRTSPTDFYVIRSKD